MKKITKWYFNLNIAYQLFPFLILYLLIAVFFAPNEFIGDEGRYVRLATNLTNGFYSLPSPDINIWCGPGYPVILTPFIVLKLPFLAIRLLNSVLLYSSLIINFKTLHFYSSKDSSLLFVIILGFYYPVFEMLPLIFTEIFTWFLISVIIYLFLKINSENKVNWKLIFFTSISIAFLALTKVIFGYVIVAMIGVSIFLIFVKTYSQTAVKSALILIIALVLCAPWLFYTYGLTNKVFYWASSGGKSLYTMSSPFEGELGDWKYIDQLISNPNHQGFMDSIAKFTQIEKDEAFTSAAIQNIKNHPEKYFLNWLANVGRLLFSYPYSNSDQTIITYLTLIPNMILLVIIFQALIFGYFNKIKFPQELIFLFLFFLIYLFGSSLVSAYRRMFYITLPFWIIFISYTYSIYNSQKK